jgi:hypothetical protein
MSTIPSHQQLSRKQDDVEAAEQSFQSTSSKRLRLRHLHLGHKWENDELESRCREDDSEGCRTAD